MDPTCSQKAASSPAVIPTLARSHPGHTCAGLQVRTSVEPWAAAGSCLSPLLPPSAQYPSLTVPFPVTAGPLLSLAPCQECLLLSPYASPMQRHSSIRMSPALGSLSEPRQAELVPPSVLALYFLASCSCVCLPHQTVSPWRPQSSGSFNVSAHL